MAKATITGATVERIIVGYGFKASESSVVKGEERKTWFTVWTDATVAEGDIVDIEGDLGVKLESFTGRDNQPKQAAAIHINNAKVSKEEAPF
jgi:hypothetical protein